MAEREAVRQFVNQDTIRLPRLAPNVQEPSRLTRIVRLDVHLYGLFQLYTIANPISIVLANHI